MSRQVASQIMAIERESSNYRITGNRRASWHASLRQSVPELRPPNRTKADHPSKPDFHSSIHSPAGAAPPFTGFPCKSKFLFTTLRRFMMLSSCVAFFAFFALLPAVPVAASQHLGTNRASKDAHLYQANRVLNRQNSRNFTLTDSAEGANFFEYVPQLASIPTLADPLFFFLTVNGPFGICLTQLMVL
jgi:hypothetical protein